MLASVRTHRALFAAGAVLVLAILALPGGSFLYEMGGGQNCARCHEIAANHESWQRSTHKDVACIECHGDALTLDPGFHLGNLRRIAVHFFGEVPERIHLRPDDVRAVSARCMSCHEQEFRQWTAGGHSATYVAIFTRPGHNSTRQLMNDCLRCHGMHHPGDIASVVSPLSMNGPWTLQEVQPDSATMPCLTCHAMHVDASAARSGFFRVALGTDEDAAGERMGKVRPSLGFYDRRSQNHVPATLLPNPEIQHGTKVVRSAKTPQNALCYQCHAPYANMQAGTNDDKTPLGPYEGMACLDCHERHTLQSRYACAEFHSDPQACTDRIPVPE